MGRTCLWDRSNLETLGVNMKVHKDHPVAHVLLDTRHSLGVSLRDKTPDSDECYDIDLPTFIRCCRILRKYNRFR